MILLLLLLFWSEAEFMPTDFRASSIGPTPTRIRRLDNESSFLISGVINSYNTNVVNVLKEILLLSKSKINTAQ